MVRISLYAVLALTLLVFQPASAIARVKPGDLAATRAYFKAKSIEGRGSGATYGAGIAAIEALDRKVSAECAGVLADAPSPAAGKQPTQTEEEITDEIGSAVPLQFEHVEHPAFARFAHTVERLRWSNHELTRLVHSYAAEQAAQSGVASPDLCADLKTWVASGYQTVSAGTKRFVHRMQVISGITQVYPTGGEPTLSVEKIISRMLAPYENRTEKASTRRTNHVSAQAERLIVRFFEAVEKVMQTLKSAPTGSAAT